MRFKLDEEVYEITQAKKEDLNKVLDLLVNAASWLKTKRKVVYLHRLVVHRKHAGQGIGAALLDWVEKEAQEAGEKIIRFDCIASNEGLNNYYQKRYPLKEVAHIHGHHSKYEIVL